MGVLRDLWLTNIWAFERANKHITTHPILMYVGLVYGPILWLTAQVAGYSSFLGGMILAIVQAMVASSYFHLIDLAIKGFKTDWQDLKNGAFLHARKVFVITFLFEVIMQGIGLLGSFTVPFIAFVIIAVGSLVAFVIYNALPEVIYQKNYAELDSIRYAWTFFKENWLNWVVPNAILIGLNFGLWFGLQVVLSPLYTLADEAVMSAATLVISMIILQFSIGYTMLYRGVLFARLNSSTRQKRIFQVKH